jgi:cobalt-zinc-cadmium efflux system outer membrane protein
MIDTLVALRRSPSRRLALAALAAFPAILAGCAHVPKDLGALEVQTQVRERAGDELSWPGADDDAPMIAALLDKPLTPESAAQMALLHNPEVAIIFAELGLSRADLIEAGTLPNPSLSAMVRFATGPASGTMTELDGAFPLLDALMLPLRKKIEAQHFEAAKLRAADRLLALISEVRTAWDDAVAAQQERGIVATSQEAATAAADLARRQYAAGNLSRLDLLSHETLEAQTRLEVRELDAAAAAKEQELRRILGLRPDDAEWMLMPVLPAAPGDVVDAAALESTALAKRLDLAAAEYRISGMEKGLQLAKRFRFTGPISVGVSADREVEGDWFVGPSLDLQLPLFDRKRGNIARFEALVAAARAERDAAVNRARAEVRTAAAALQSAADRAAAYDNELLPLHRDLLEETQLHYNGMLVGVYDVLAAKRTELEAQRGAVRARLDYWRARNALERAIAGPLPGGASPLISSTPVAPKPAATGGEHEHHEEK